jgi:hypothetical protein
MEKVLKKYTTIPEHLYVEREADIQLRGIIEEMQRPGYVLVARQMGKTNLLFNAKRTLENNNRLFIYVDLSNLYDNDRDCYRNIINNIIEPNPELLGEIETDIEKIREKNLPPHNEYSRSLRTVLNFFKGDLVIILDEIDALKSVSYSDNIFAQIRSNYFSRTNFPVFERLTYVLSGVIEPTELITDRNKSPFNIGDKIYLDDFTKEEHNKFIIKTKLIISKKISDEIFNWTNGNPRLTFDICSEIENEILLNNEINEKLLENIINKKYLTSFDIAPIDHIRELARTNKQIRKAITQIHRNKSAEINDEIKNKLYLFGIINSKFNDATKIKNKIIELSLSEDWLKSIEKEKEISFVYGLAKYGSDEFEEAIEIFEEVIIDTNSSTNIIEESNYFIGLSYYKLGNYNKAIEYFGKDFLTESCLVDSKSYLGICKIITGSKAEGIIYLEEAVKKDRKNFAYHNAILNLAINTEDEDKAYNLFEKLFHATYESENEKEEDLNKLRTLSLYYQATILNAKNLKSKALEKTNSALEFSDPSDSPYLYFFKYDLTEEKDEFLKEHLVNAILDNKLTFTKVDSNPIGFTENLLLYYLDFIYNYSNNELFNKLLEYSISNLLKSTKYELIYLVSLISLTNKENLLNNLLDNKIHFDNKLLINIYKELALINDGNPN